jgi:hypothetical protein
MKAVLKLIVARIMLGLNILKPQTLTKWLSELLQKFHFLPSYWQPAYSYGQTQRQTQALHQPMVSLQATTCHVHRDSQATPSAGTKKKKLSKNFSDEHRISISFNKLLDFSLEKYKIRLLNGLYTFWENKRLRWGLLTLMVIAPLTKFLYLLFPEQGFGEYLINVGPFMILNTIEGEANGWYWAYIQMYVFSNGELLAPTISIFGLFLLFPKKYYPSYLAGVPFGYYLSMFVHRMFYVTDFNSFHNGFPGSVMIGFLLLGVVFFIISDNVMFKQNHGKRAAEARIIGLVNMPGMEWGDKEEIIRKEVAEVMKVDNELFIKESA